MTIVKQYLNLFAPILKLFIIEKPDRVKRNKVTFHCCFFNVLKKLKTVGEA